VDIKNRIALPKYIASHPANRGHVLRALARAAAFQLKARLTRRPVLTNLGDAKIWVHAGSTAATKVIYGSPPDWEEMLAWKRVIKRGDLFIDVGANVGTYSLWVASAGARVKAVEPDTLALERLHENVRLNPRFDIEVIPAALAEHEGTVRFTEGLDTVNRIGGTRTVNALTLDVLLGEGSARGVKIDVEGFEQVVLAGARDAIASHRIDIFQLEWNGMSRTSVGADRQPIADMLRSAGYELMRPDLAGILSPSNVDGFGADVFAVSPDAHV
jgi:FkbM family methyltransferase